MKTRRRRLLATMSFLLSLGPCPASAGSSEWENDGTGKRLAEISEKASTDRRALTELYRMQEGYVDRATGEWRDGAERKKLQEAIGLLQRNTDRNGPRERGNASSESVKRVSARERSDVEKRAMAEILYHEKYRRHRFGDSYHAERLAHSQSGVAAPMISSASEAHF